MLEFFLFVFCTDPGIIDCGKVAAGLNGFWREKPPAAALAKNEEKARTYFDYLNREITSEIVRDVKDYGEIKGQDLSDGALLKTAGYKIFVAGVTFFNVRAFHINSLIKSYHAIQEKAHEILSKASANAGAPKTPILTTTSISSSSSNVASVDGTAPQTLADTSETPTTTSSSPNATSNVDLKKEAESLSKEIQAWDVADAIKAHADKVLNNTSSSDVPADIARTKQFMVDVKQALEGIKNLQPGLRAVAESRLYEVILDGKSVSGSVEKMNAGIKFLTEMGLSDWIKVDLDDFISRLRTLASKMKAFQSQWRGDTNLSSIYPTLCSEDRDKLFQLFPAMFKTMKDFGLDSWKPELIKDLHDRLIQCGEKDQQDFLEGWLTEADALKQKYPQMTDEEKGKLFMRGPVEFLASSSTTTTVQTVTVRDPKPKGSINNTNRGGRGGGGT